MKESYNQVMRLRFRHFDIENASRIKIKFSQGKRKMLVEYDASDESVTKKVWFDSESKLLCVKWTREDTWRFDSGAEIEGDAMIFLYGSDENPVTKKFTFTLDKSVFGKDDFT